MPITYGLWPAIEVQTMVRYSAYLEIADDGRCMAHVLDLPGCIVRAPTRDDALSRVPESIRETHATRPLPG